MFEDRIAALNKDTEAMPSIPYEKRIYTVDGLHLNKIGYKAVANKLIKYLDE